MIKLHRPSSSGPANRDPLIRDPLADPSPAIDLNTPALWEAAVIHSDKVLEELKREPDFSSVVLYGVVSDLTSGQLDASDIIAVYHNRMKPP